MARQKQQRKIRLPVPLPEDLHERLRRAAAQDDRTMAGFVVAAIRRALDEFEASRKK